ncbi:MAG: NHL repeat-containing protein [Nitrospiraceae bacterium]|nr:MAG: NHL repeat-containing protein [Nitrospiraceae bacterium]
MADFIRKIKGLHAVSILWGLAVLYGAPAIAPAQQLGPVITFQEIISTDEDGGRLFFPSFVYTDPVTEEVYLIDGKGRVIIFNNHFFPLYTASKRNGIENPQGLAIGPDGRLYVGQAASESNRRHRISVFSPCLKWERNIYLEGFERSDTFVPYRLAVDKKGTLYVTANNYPGVLVLDNSGRLRDIISPLEGDKKVIITNVILDSEDNMYLVSEEEGHIYVYDRERKPLRQFGEKGGSSGKLSRPRSVGVDSRHGRMYVSDYMRHTITVYDREGAFLFEFGGLGWGEGWFQHPIELHVDNKGRIIVTDTFNQRVQVFNSW